MSAENMTERARKWFAKHTPRGFVVGWRWHDHAINELSTLLAQVRKEALEEAACIADKDRASSLPVPSLARRRIAKAIRSLSLGD